MDQEYFLRGFVAAFALVAGVMFLRFAVDAQSEARDSSECDDEPSGKDRLRRADDARERISALPRYAVSGVGFGIAILVFAHIVSPAVGYAIVCLSLAIRAVADLVSEEHAPRRHSALLGRARNIDAVLLAWIAMAAVSALSLIPYVLEGADRVAAILVCACVAAMLLVAWRIASAPPLLAGDDLDAEQVVDRETRATRTGNACFLAIAAVAVFNGFTGPVEASATSHFSIVVATFVVAAGLLVWKSAYARRLSRTPLAS